VVEMVAKDVIVEEFQGKIGCPDSRIGFFCLHQKKVSRAFF